MSIPVLETKILYRKLLSVIKPEIVFDIGSCDGSESIKSAKILPDSAVVAFEANPNNYRQIATNSDVKKYNISVYNLAIQHSDDEVSFNIIDSDAVKNRGSSSLLNKPGFPSRQVKVKGSRLDSFVNKHFSKSKSLALWIDVEGAGYQVLQGIDSICDQIMFFQIEVEENQVWEGQRTKSDIIEFANSLNFREIARGSGGNQYDIVFINENFEGKFDLPKILRITLLECRIRKSFTFLRDLKRKYIFKS
jgi:FkbM family methyltransferase